MATKKNLVKSLLIIALVSIFALAYFAPSSFGVIQGHHPVVIQGHSPINLLVIDQSTGLETGCVNGQNLVQIPSSTYSGCGTEPQSVNITTPSVGTFAVVWSSTLTGGQQGQFNVTITVCNNDNSDSKNNGHPEGLCSPQDKDDKPVTYTLISETPIGAGDNGNSQFNYQSNGGIILPTTVSTTVTNTVIVPTTITETATTTSTSTGYATVTNTLTTSSNTTIPVTTTSQTTAFTTTTIPATASTTVTETSSTNYVTVTSTKTVTSTTGECPDGDSNIVSLNAPAAQSNAATTTIATSATPSVTVTVTATATSTSTQTDSATSTIVTPLTITSTSNTTLTEIIPVTLTTTQTQTSTSTVPVTVTQTNTATVTPTATVTKKVIHVVKTCYSDNDPYVASNSVSASISSALIASLSLIGVAGFVFTVRGSYLGGVIQLFRAVSKIASFKI